MPQYDMSTIVALAIAAGITAAVIGIAMAVATAKVKMIMELTAKAMAQKIIDKRTAKAAAADALISSAAVASIANRVADDMDGDLARQNFVDAAADAGMTAEEAQQTWWETESARSFNLDVTLMDREPVEDDAAIAKAARRIHWNGYYLDRALDRGLSYEEAIEMVDVQEQRIEQALAYVHAGMSVDDALYHTQFDDVAHEDRS